MPDLKVTPQRAKAFAELFALLQPDNRMPPGAPFAAISDEAISAFEQVEINLIQNAHRGAVDPALALKRRWFNICQYSIVTDPMVVKATFCCWPDGLSGGTEILTESYCEDGEDGRALLACLIEAAQGVMSLRIAAA